MLRSLGNSVNAQSQVEPHLSPRRMEIKDPQDTPYPYFFRRGSRPLGPPQTRPPLGPKRAPPGKSMGMGILGTRES